MSREILINHADIQNSQTITKVMEEKFKANDLDLHRHEVVSLEDDHKRGVRKLEVKSTRYYLVPDLPWKQKPSS